MFLRGNDSKFVREDNVLFGFATQWENEFDFERGKRPHFNHWTKSSKQSFSSSGGSEVRGIGRCPQAMNRKLSLRSRRFRERLNSTLVPFRLTSEVSKTRDHSWFQGRRNFAIWQREKRQQYQKEISSGFSSETVPLLGNAENINTSKFIRIKISIPEKKVNTSWQLMFQGNAVLYNKNYDVLHFQQLHFRWSWIDAFDLKKIPWITQHHYLITREEAGNSWHPILNSCKRTLRNPNSSPNGTLGNCGRILTIEITVQNILYYSYKMWAAN